VSDPAENSEDEQDAVEQEREEDLLEPQEGKGYGEDEGERPEALPE
jgi:hypothetical protein